MTDAYEVVIWFDAAQKPVDHTERQPTHTERERFETVEEAREFIKEQLWQVDNLEENGRELHDGRKEYGYWSKAKDRETGKQWYQWATVEVRKLDIETMPVHKVLEE